MKVEDLEEFPAKLESLGGPSVGEFFCRVFVYGLGKSAHAMIGSCGDHADELWMYLGFKLKVVYVVVHGWGAHNGHRAAKHVYAPYVGTLCSGSGLMQIPLYFVLMFYELFYKFVYGVDHRTLSAALYWSVTSTFVIMLGCAVIVNQKKG